MFFRCACFYLFFAYGCIKRQFKKKNLKLKSVLRVFEPYQEKEREKMKNWKNPFFLENLGGLLQVIAARRGGGDFRSSGTCSRSEKIRPRTAWPFKLFLYFCLGEQEKGERPPSCSPCLPFKNLSEEVAASITRHFWARATSLFLCFSLLGDCLKCW